MNVLIVEDDVDVADTVAEVARLVGYSVRIANSVREGLAALDFRTPDILICDFELGDGTGEEVLRHAAAAHPSALRVLMTSAPKSISQRLFASGLAARLLGKPFEVDALLTLLRDYSRDKLCA